MTGPPCRCDYNKTHSPNRLAYNASLTDSTTLMDQQWWCFSLKAVTTGSICGTAAGVNETCCNADVFKIEFRANPNCRGATNRALLFPGFNTSVAGIPVVQQLRTIGVEINRTADPPTALIRISKLNVTQAVLAAFPGGLPICINVRDPSVCDAAELFRVPELPVAAGAVYSLFNLKKDCCPTDTTIFFGASPALVAPPSPPPPSMPPSPPSPEPLTPVPPTPSGSAPPPPFKFCNCKTYALDSYPWRIALANKTAAMVGDRPAERVCLKLFVDGAASSECNPAWNCCTQGLQKIELVANARCRGAITPFNLTGVPGRKSSFSWGASVYEPGTPVLKFTKLDLTYAQGLNGGASMCFILKGDTCNKWEDLCPGGSCTSAVFDSSANNCCPQMPVGQKV